MLQRLLAEVFGSRTVFDKAELELSSVNRYSPATLELLQIGGVVVARFPLRCPTLKLIRDRFQNECVVCHSSEAVDVAHLYEDASIRMADPERLILLCPTHNQAMDRAHGRDNAIPSGLRPENLLGGARTDYWDGKYWHAYGKARLSAYFFEKQGAFSEAVDALTEATSALRPLRWGDWLAAIFREAERLCEQYDIGIAVRWLLLDRVALVLFDYSRWQESAEVLAAAVQLREKIPTYSRSHQQFNFDKNSSRRREGLIKAETGKLNRTEPLPILLKELEEQADDFDRLGRFDSSATHRDVIRKLLLERVGDPEKAHGQSEKALAKRTKISHKWVLLEHLISEAEYFSHKKDKARALQYASEAMELFSQNPIILEPIVGARAPLQERVWRLGIKPDDLLNRGVAVAPDVEEKPLPLTRTAVNRFAKTVLKHGCS